MHQTYCIDIAIRTLQKLRAKMPDKPHEPGAKQPSNTDLSTMSREFDAVAQECAWLSEYMSWRGGAGCGDHGEVKAAKKADARCRKLRRALGYSIP